MLTTMVGVDCVMEKYVIILFIVDSRLFNCWARLALYKCRNGIFDSCAPTKRAVITTEINSLLFMS